MKSCRVLQDHYDKTRQPEVHNRTPDLFYTHRVYTVWITG